MLCELDDGPKFAGHGDSASPDGRASGPDRDTTGPDRNTAACYALADLARDRLTFFRVPYDYETAAQKIRAAGLPERIARRLERGA